MAGELRTTYGFGRIASTATPSPYSPLHRPSEMPGATTPVASPRAARGHRWPLVAALAGVAVAAGLAAGLLKMRSAPAIAVATPVAAPVKPPAPALPGDEAARLPRSAIAVHRQAPRPRS